MSSRSSSRASTKKDYPSDTLDNRLRKENFNRLKSIFEIRRPNKARYPTLRKSKSTSALSGSASQSSDDEKETNKEVVFVRNSSSRCSIRSDKYKKRSMKTDSRGHSFKNSDNSTPEDNKTPTLLIAELETKLKKHKKAEERDPFATNFTFAQPYLQKCEAKETSHKTDYSTDNTAESENEVFSSSEDMYNQRKYTTSTFKSHKTNSNYAPENNSTKNSKSSKELITKQSDNDKKRIKSFVEADCEGETEKYRKNLVSEMDREVAKMKLDGFIDDDENLNIEDTEQDINEETEESAHQINRENEHIHLVASEENYSKNKYKQLFEGIFSELDKNMQMIEYESLKTLQLENNNKYDNKHGNQSKSDNEEVLISQEEPRLTVEEQFKRQGKKDISGEHDSIYLAEEKPLLDESNAIHNVRSSDTELAEKEKKGIEEIHSIEQDSLNNEAGISNTNDESATKLSTNKLHPNTLTRPVSFEDEFCESLGDDLENGSYFVEAYNDEGRELVIVEISLERRTVNLDKPFPLKNIEKSIKDADMVFHERDDKSLNLIEDAKEFIHENSEAVSSEFYNGPDSNRSTVYSTTSRESDVFDDDDEGISMGNVELKTRTDDDGYNNVRRETFCDHKGIVRIERVGYPEAIHTASLEDLQPSVSRNNSFTQKGKLSYIIDEIKSTEKKYVADLNKVVKKYMPYIERHTPTNLLGRQYFMFGNIQTLCENQKKFLGALESCDEEAEDIIRTFIDFKDLFKLYPTYFKNKPKADVVIKEFNTVIKQAQERFKERLDLSAYLLTPLQRLGKYKLFLENIEKQLRKLELPTENATTALEIIKREMSKGNDFVAIESIQNSPILKSDYGSFKMREIFTIIKPRRFESMVFLFENVVVFTTLGSQRNMEIYTYYDSIKMNDLRIATFEDTTIHLTNFTKGKQVSRADRFTYVIEAKTEKLKDIWRKAVEDILWQQLYKVKENTLKMYQTKPTKRGKISRSRIKSAGKGQTYLGASVFYVSDY